MKQDMLNSQIDLTSQAASWSLPPRLSARAYGIINL